MDVLPAQAWRPVEPVTGRTSNRVSEREFEKIRAWIAPIHSASESAKRPVSLWDFSPFGFAVIQNASKPSNLIVNEGDAIRLSLELGGCLLHADCIVKNKSVFKGQIRIGLARHDLARRIVSGHGIGVPHGEYVRLPEKLDLRAEAPNPIFFGEWSSMCLHALRPGLKLDFLVKDPAMPLFLGQRLDVHLALPTSDDNCYRGRITGLERAPGASVKARMEPISISSGLANDLAELLAFEAGVSPETLRRFGFPTRFFRNRVTFRYVENMQDYEEVLTLRRNAYVEVGKRGADTAPEEMSIAWDKTSRILCAYHDGVLVASAALTFPASESVTLRSETAFPGNRFPGNPPPKSQLLEVNSLCTHRDYRRGDLLHAMFEQIARIFVLSDRNYIMNLSDSNLLPMYLGIGFKAQGETGVFLGRPHHLIVGPREAVIKSRGIGLLRWNLLYGDLMEDVLSKRLLEFPFWDRMMIKARLALKPLANHLLRRHGDRKLRRDIQSESRT